MSVIDTNYNEQYYDAQWENLSDYIKYNPGAKHRKRFIFKLLSKIRFKTLLDVGCGNGELLLQVLQKYGDSVKLEGADLSKKVAEDNKSKLPNVDFSHIDIQSDHLNGQYDVVTCSEVIEHLEDRKKAFKHLSAMVKDGGHLLVTCPAGKVYETEKYYGHVSHPDFSELEQLGQENQLAISNIYNWGWPFYKSLKWATNVNAKWAIKNFGDTKYGFFQKFVSTFLYFANFFNFSKGLGCQYFVLYKKGDGATDQKTADAFASSWNNLPRGSVYTPEQFMDWIAPLTEDNFKDKEVLEMGCGNGSLMYHAVSLKPKSILGIDLGESVVSAKESLSLSNQSNWEVKQYDLTEYQEKSFDLVYSIGVLHHLKDQKKGFDSVLRATKPGGHFHCWVYAYEGNAVVRWIVEPLRWIGSKMPWWFTKYCMATPTVLPYYLYANFLHHTKSLWKPTWLPLYEYSLWIAKRNFAFFRHVAFDQLVTPQTVYLKKSELEQWLKDSSIEPESNYIIFRNGNSWKFGGKKNPL